MSKLNDYIGKLMHDDDALKAFLNDPVKAGEKENGITKAERAVLRRTVFHLSNNSKNGYSLQRDLSSYRRSIRLLQNVVHGVANKARGAALTHALNADQQIMIQIYYTGNTSEAGAPYTDPGLAYAYHVNCYGTGSTIGEVMNFQPSSNPTLNEVVSGTIPGHTSDGQSFTVTYEATYLHKGESGPLEPYITSFTIPNEAGLPEPGTYKIPLPTSTKTRDPFWFYSENGVAIKKDQMTGIYNKVDANTTGGEAESFASFSLDSKTHVIVWQPIAPDKNYGFGACN